MSGHVFEFFVGVYHHWIALAAGVISLAIAVFERARKRPITSSVFVGVGIIALFIACFQAWDEERTKVESLNTLALTPADLTHIFKDRTDAQGDELVKMHVGKWLMVSGSITNTQKNWNIWPMPETYLVTVYQAQGTNEDNPYVLLEFDRKWIGAVSALQPKEKIKVRGRIYRINRSGIWLNNCELVGFGEAQTN